MNSRKVYVPGKMYPDIRVGMREILTEDPETPVVPVYDTSGPYSDVDAKLDVTKGIERFRESWIMERGDAEQLDDMTSAYGRARRANHELDHLRFNAEHHPLRAKAGHHLTQLDYARKGIVTKEMEYVAIRENQRCRPRARSRLKAPPLRRNSCATKSPRAARFCRGTSTTRNANR